VSPRQISPLHTPCPLRRPSSSLARPNFKDGAIRHPLIEEGLHQCRCLRLHRRAPRAQRQRWRLHTCLRRDAAQERLLFEHLYFLHMREYASCVIFCNVQTKQARATVRLRRALGRHSQLLASHASSIGSPPPGLCGTSPPPPSPPGRGCHLTPLKIPPVVGRQLRPRPRNQRAL